MSGSAGTGSVRMARGTGESRSETTSAALEALILQTRPVQVQHTGPVRLPAGSTGTARKPFYFAA